MARKTSPRTPPRQVTTSCSYDCGARCVLKVQVEDGRITRIGTVRDPDLRACPKGLRQRDVVYAPDRILTPLKRTGPRGEGRFAPIGWDEAYETVAGELERVKREYGTDSIFLMDYSGSMSPLYGIRKAARRFFAMYGGCSSHWGSASMEGAIISSLATFGTTYTGVSRDNFLHSRLIIMWGWNPMVSRFGPDTYHYLRRAGQSGVPIVAVDPRLSQTAKALGARWLPIRPATDAAMLIAMAYVLIDEDLHDRSFLATHTVGFESYREYVLGTRDGTPKTPRWAQEITGVPAAEIAGLAREYARLRPAALYTGWAPGRTACGEQFHRAASALTAMTGNVGITGSFPAGSSGRRLQGILGQTLPVPESTGPQVHIVRIFDALLRGKAGGHPCDIKLLYIVGSNLLTQFPNLNKGAQALQRPEFIVAHERFLTPTARYADIVLPVATCLEGVDIAEPRGGGPYFIAMEQAIAPVGESKTDLRIFAELARHVGLEGYSDKSEAEWLASFAAATPELPPYEEFKRKGVHRIPLELPWVTFREQIEDPENHPFPTPSGKIEIESSRFAERGDPRIPAVPTYMEPWEGPADPLARRYPLQLISPHSRARVNSQFDNIPRLKAYADDALWLNTADAEERGITHGARVRVFNDRGAFLATAKVTDRIMGGVASLDQGIWFDPGEDGVDRRGAVNVLTRDEPSPAGAFACNSCLVEVEKAPD